MGRTRLFESPASEGARKGEVFRRKTGPVRVPAQLGRFFAGS
jgi:hypothetical protein